MTKTCLPHGATRKGTDRAPWIAGFISCSLPLLLLFLFLFPAGTTFAAGPAGTAYGAGPAGATFSGSPAGTSYAAGDAGPAGTTFASAPAAYAAGPAGATFSGSPAGTAYGAGDAGATFSAGPVAAAFAAGDDQHGENYSPGLKRGERLFYGLVAGKFEGRACADCHNTMEIDTFNWNPSAWEIAHKYKEQSTDAFTKAVLNPTGRTMTATHLSFNLNEAELALIKEFLDHLEVEGLTTTKPVINKIFLFLLLGALLTWIVLEVIFLKRVKRHKWILGVLFLGALGWQIALLLEAGIDLGRQENYEPDQPIKFSHMVHATDNQIDCNYCHHTVEQSKSAGFPETELCMNCHIIIREGTHSGRHEISKLVAAYETEEPIEWVRIHNLQDHAWFSHAQHVAVAQIDCQTCHGPVESMHRVKQVSDLSMGWCINCHRDTGVQFFDNAFYEEYEALHARVEAGEIDRVTADLTGGTECSKCHY